MREQENTENDPIFSSVQVRKKAGGITEVVKGEAGANL